MEKQYLEDGIHKVKNWIVFSKNKVLIYGFRVTPKGISEKQKELEIREIFRKTDELCGNKQGDDFIKTQIKYDG